MTMVECGDWKCPYALVGFTVRKINDIKVDAPNLMMIFIGTYI
jgi:hypothetical protein